MSTTARTKPRTRPTGGSPFQLVNPGTVGMTYDELGHQVDAGSRVKVDEVDRVGRKAVRRKYLLCQDADGTWVTFDEDGRPVPRPVATSDEDATPDGVADDGPAKNGTDRDGGGASRPE